jgi:hypothetical protein
MIRKRFFQTLTFATFSLGWLSGPGPSQCQAGVIPDLGTAANYGVLGLENTSINNSLVTINGNEGVSQGGSLVNMAPSTITGNVYEFATGQYSGPGHLGGSVITNPSLLTQNDTDALNASTAAAALAPTQTLSGVGSPTVVNGNGGLNVIDVNGNITNSLTLNGTSSDFFVVNVTGNVALGGSSVLGLSGGVTAANVLYNFIGSDTVATHVGNTLNGTLLGPNTSFNLDGTFNGEIIGGGKSISLLSGAVVNFIPFTQPTPPVPEIDPGSAAGALTLLCGGTLVLADRRRRRSDSCHLSFALWTSGASPAATGRVG